MSWKKKRIGDFLLRSKIPVDIEDNKEYKRVTIRINHNGVSLRDVEKGKKIGTKKQFILKAGQFILSKIDARYGAFGIAPDEADGGIITGNFWAYDFDKSKINIDWLNQYTNSPEFYEICERASTGITHRKYLDEETFLNHEIYLPDTDEQKIVVENVRKQKKSFSFLSDEIILQQSLLSQLRQAFLREAMQGKLTTPLSFRRGAGGEVANAKDLLQKIKAEKEKLGKKEKPLPPIKPDEIPFAIPENWVWCRLGDLALYSEAGSSFKCEEIPVSNGEWGVIKVSAVSWDNFLEDKNKVYSKSKPDDISAKVKVGDFLISRANTSELVGKSVVVKSISKNLLLSDKTIRFKFSDFVSTEFVHLCNNYSKHARVYYALKGTGSSPSMKNITREHMRNLPIPLPPLPEQKRIVKKLEEVMNLCDELKTTITNNQTYTGMLLQVALKDALQPKQAKRYKLPEHKLSIAAEE